MTNKCDVHIMILESIQIPQEEKKNEIIHPTKITTNFSLKQDEEST